MVMAWLVALETNIWEKVLVGNTSNKPVLNDIYFFKLDLADIIPMSVPNASLINSIAQSIGLHDFYQVGLWNFCEGYINEYVPSPSPQNIIQNNTNTPPL